MDNEGSHDVENLNNKISFEDLLKNQNIPTVKTLFVVELNDENTTFASLKLPDSVFVKPVSGNRSIGCYLIERDTEHNVNVAENSYIVKRISDGMTFSGCHASLIDNNIIKPRKNDLLIQETLTNHSALHSAVKSGLLVFRVVTFFHQARGSVEYAYCEHSGANGDHQSVVYGLNLKTLACYAINMNIGDFVSGEINSDIASIVYDYWAEIADLCLSAHQCFQSVVAIGWDVALSDDGPIIIEGNSHWATEILQSDTGKPLLTDRIMSIYSMKP